MRTGLGALVLVPAFVGALAAIQAPSLENVKVTQAEFKKLFDSKRVAVIDTRGGRAYKDCHIRGAIELPPNAPAAQAAFDAAVEKLKAAKKTVVTYCACPHEEEALLVAAVLKERHLDDVRVLAGGWNDWFNAGNPVSCRER